MAERTFGGYGETDFKQYGSEYAGQKIGWTTVVPNEDASSFFVVGAFATVGEKGATVGVSKHSETGKYAWHTGLTKGLSRACGYRIFIDLDNRFQYQNTDTIRFDMNDASDVAGHSHYFDRPIDDVDNVVWSVGDNGLTSAIREGLAANEVESMYPYLYLWLNGSSGMQYIEANPHATLEQIAEAQITDPSLLIILVSSTGTLNYFMLICETDS